MATIKVKQTKSRIKCPKDQKRTLDALGLKQIYIVRIFDLIEDRNDFGRSKSHSQPDSGSPPRFGHGLQDDQIREFIQLA